MCSMLIHFRDTVHALLMPVASPKLHGYFKETQHATKVSIIRFKELFRGLVTHGHFLLRNLNL